MAGKPLHLGWFMNFTPGEWDHPLAAGGAPWDGKFYVDMAQALERACFDYIMIEDTLMVSEAYGDSAEAALKHALQVPKHDPAPLAALISAATTRLGVVATLSTLAYPPFMLARLCSTLDHIAGGRFGWNIVTSGEDIADLYQNTRAKGFGAEVRRRLMIGTYVLSAGYYDAYYVRAQKIRTLIKCDFERSEEHTSELQSP